MKVSELISLLDQRFHPDEDLVVAWWGRERFEAADSLSHEEWERAADHMKQHINWDDVEIALNDALIEYLEAGN